MTELYVCFSVDWNDFEQVTIIKDSQPKAKNWCMRQRNNEKIRELGFYITTIDLEIERKNRIIVWSTGFGAG